MSVSIDKIEIFRHSKLKVLLKVPMLHGVERNQKQETGSFQELPELVPAALYTKVQLVFFLNSLFPSKSRSLNHEDLLSFQDISYYLKYEYRKKESTTPLGIIIFCDWIIDYWITKSLIRKKKLDKEYLKTTLVAWHVIRKKSILLTLYRKAQNLLKTLWGLKAVCLNRIKTDWP